MIYHHDNNTHLVQNEMNTLHKFLSSNLCNHVVFHQDAVKNMDNTLKLYYNASGRYDYHQKLCLLYTLCNDLDTTFGAKVTFEDRMNDLNELKELADYLGITLKEIFLVLQTGYNSTHFIVHSVDDDDDEKYNNNEDNLTWLNVMNIIYHWFDVKWFYELKKTQPNLAQILSKSFKELDPFQHHRALLVSDEEWKYLKNVITKYANYKTKYRRMVAMNMVTNSKMEYIRDVYFVHKMFIEENNKTQLFTPKRYHNLLIENHIITWKQCICGSDLILVYGYYGECNQ